MGLSIFVSPFFIIMKLLKRFFTVLMVLLGIFSLCCFLFPTVSNIINSHFNESHINNYTHNINTLSKSDVDSLTALAIEYNKAVAADYFDSSLNDEFEEIFNNYKNIMNVDNGIIGYIEIPKISVRLPIYHGESDETLKKGAAHLEQTSFPVISSVSTRCCISAHSGYPTQKFFDNIDELDSGDPIYLHILNQTLIYKVDKKEVVKPEEVTKLAVENGRDLLTLITCYPYGINSHRLIVDADYIETKVIEHSASETVELNETSKVPWDYIILGSVIVVVAIFLAVCIIRHLKRKT